MFYWHMEEPSLRNDGRTVIEQMMEESSLRNHGCLQVDGRLLSELETLKQRLNMTETLLLALQVSYTNLWYIKRAACISL